MNKRMISTACVAAAAVACVGTAAAGDADAGHVSISEGRVGAVSLSDSAKCQNLANSLQITQPNPVVHAPADGEAWVRFRPIVYLPSAGEWRLDRADRAWSGQIHVRPGSPARWPGVSVVNWHVPTSQVMMGFDVLFTPAPVSVGGSPHRDAPEQNSQPQQHPGPVNDILTALTAGKVSVVQTTYTLADNRNIPIAGTSGVCTKTASGVENLPGVGVVPYPGMPSPVFPPAGALGPILTDG